MMDLPTDGLDLFAYPYSVGTKGGETSVAAGFEMEPIAPLLRDKTLAYVARCNATGTTVVEACERNGWDRFAYQPRFSELRAIGKIADSGLRRPNPSGKMAAVWMLPQFVREPGQ
jgi:hypothetical protein